VHASAVVDPKAELGDGVSVGPFCYVGAGVELGPRTELVAHVTVLGPTRMGAGNRVFPYATLGAEPQDKSHRDEATRLEIGDDNVFREQVSVHRGTTKGSGVTRIGSNNWLLVGAHVAHDCQLGDGVVLTNLATLGGHVVVADNVVCGGHVAVAPFVRVGRGVFLAGGACVERDVPPFVIAAGDRARIRGLNSVGLKRMGVSEQSQRVLKKAFGMLFRSRVPLAQALPAVREELGSEPLVVELVDFLAQAK
jgi:UDP-N-acetylglucosamine acyltransferase